MLNNLNTDNAFKFVQDGAQVIFDPHTWYGAVFYGIVILFVAIIISRVVRVAAQRIILREDLVDRAVVMFLTQLCVIVVYIVAMIIFFHIIPALNKLGTALLTGVSVMSVVFGLAAQNTLGNLVAGCTLLMYRPFHLDDLIQVATPTGTEYGIVERLTLGYTMLRTLDDRLVIVPNSLMASQVSLNLNRGSVHTMLFMPIGVDSAHAPEVRTALLDIAQNNPKIHQVSGCLTRPLEDNKNVILSLRAWCANIAVTGEVRTEIAEQLQQRFNGRNIRLMFPSSPLTGPVASSIPVPVVTPPPAPATVSSALAGK